MNINKNLIIKVCSIILSNGYNSFIYKIIIKLINHYSYIILT